MSDTFSDTVIGSSRASRTVVDAIPIEVQSALERIDRLSRAFGQALVKCNDPEARAHLQTSGTLFNLAAEEANRKGPDLLDNPAILNATFSAIMTPLNGGAVGARLRDKFSNELFSSILTVIEQTQPMQCFQTLRAYNRQLSR